MWTSRWNAWFLVSLIGFLLPGAPIAHAASDSLNPQNPHVQDVTLDNLLAEALQNSPGLQAKKRAYEAARARVISAWLPDDPQIGADVEGQSSLFQFDRTDNEYSIVQTVPFPTKLILRAQRAAKQAAMAYQDYKEKERDIMWHIEQPYYELLLAKKTAAALEEIQGLFMKLSKTVQARYESNRASQQDLLEAQIESSKVGIDLFQWQQKAHLAEAHLSHILNRPLDTSYTVPEEPIPTAPTLSRSDLESLAAKVRPELKALEMGIRRAKTNRLLAQTNWLPDLTGHIEVRQFSGEGNIREYDTFLGITVPVWSLLKGVGGEWKGAEREVQEAEATYTEMKNEVLLAVHEAYSKVQVAQRAIETYKDVILPQAKQQVEVAFASYEAGRTDLLPLIDAQRTLEDTEIAYARMQADYERGLSDLRLAVGGNLP